MNAKHQICDWWAEEGDFVIFVMVAVAFGGLGGGCGFWGFRWWLWLWLLGVYDGNGSGDDVMHWSVEEKIWNRFLGEI